LVGKSEGIRPLGGHRSGCEDNIKMKIKYDRRLWTLFSWRRVGMSGDILNRVINL
jgi:hypothetical protein